MIWKLELGRTLHSNIHTKVAFLPRRQALQVALAFAHKLILLRLNEYKRGEVRLAPNECVLKNENLPPIYTRVWSVWHWEIRKPLWTASTWRHATASQKWGQEQAVGVQPHAGCVTPGFLKNKTRLIICVPRKSTHMSEWKSIRNNVII
jgi:hypothetical protein